MARDHRPFVRHLGIRAAVAAVPAALAMGALGLAALPGAAAAGKPLGDDVSSHQKNVDWGAAKGRGASFVYVKATESTWYRNPYFAQQYDGARQAGLVRGAYHFAVPDQSSGRAQAAYFVQHGGGWRRDGWTLPPALDLEHNPYSNGDSSDKCYGLSPAAMTEWITAFSDEVRLRTGRRPVIYTTAPWWHDCTRDSRAFAATHPLWLARYAASPGALPAGWSRWTFWQYANGSGSLPGDQNLFNGTFAQLKKFARG
ncbi:lysozyme [Streptomyces sp. NPDC051994]|uniref:lysozyme n=1 Tax=unclassified Streptomyces TaxID=2593676 RepID=UPI0034425869